MNKIFLTLVLMIFFMAGCAPPGNVQKITVGIDDNYAPMGFRDEHGEIVGFDIDLAKEAAERMNVEFVFKPIDWNNKEAEITSGRVDMIWNGCDITDERKRYMIFSKPYMDNRQIILVRKGDNQEFYSEVDLADKVVGTQAGSNSEDYINENQALKESFKSFKTYPNYKAAFEDLEKGFVDVLIVDEIAGRYEMSKQPVKFESREVTIGPSTELGIGFKKDNVELRDKVQKVFDDMIKDGTARKISEQWFQADLIKLRK